MLKIKVIALKATIKYNNSLRAYLIKNLDLIFLKNFFIRNACFISI